ncbi:hypothetical protein GALMADRAFT_221795 [Galerina marginata CBS 339.88]|uniref:Secreted protein n=1 Tax=Galerina marginata (strain CBS 339.88) TaxID=685588 RepID=A0A067THU5_GALM3|nr:hypothetical protein GALMADRAFT_221795 [Galerina marginata CBS 339.88]
MTQLVTCVLILAVTWVLPRCGTTIYAAQRSPPVSVVIRGCFDKTSVLWAACRSAASFLSSGLSGSSCRMP